MIYLLFIYIIYSYYIFIYLGCIYTFSYCIYILKKLNYLLFYELDYKLYNG